MEFSEKLQQLRKAKGLTQEQLAQKLFVSRTAVSKWESGRGYPEISSLKEIAKIFSVTIDELLSADEIITIANKEKTQRDKLYRNLVFGALDVCVVLLFFFPIFAQRIDGTVYNVSLVAMTGVTPFLKTIYNCFVGVNVLYGLLNLSLQNVKNIFWHKYSETISVLLNVISVVLFVAGLQPYAAVLMFVFLMIKVIFLVKSK